MKNLMTVLCCCAILLSAACNKNGFTSSPDAYLYNTAFDDTINFDTVFTSVGSVTQSFKIMNPNKQGVRISDLRLYGGNNAAFKINVNGMPGSDFSDLEIAGGDSIYVFVTVNIDPDNVRNPFLIRDSIGYTYNGNQDFVQLKAYGQNAVFLKPQTISHDTTWDNRLPIVLLGNIIIDKNSRLTIEKGTRIYAHAKAVLLIDGSLKANGGIDTVDRIVFTNDRMDIPYNLLSGSWGGIRLGKNSHDNSLENVTIRNAEKGIADTTNINAGTNRLTLNGCIIFNNTEEALLLRHSGITATNCLFYNSGSEINMEGGGNYHFTYCTIAGFGNDYVPHIYPSVSISDTQEGIATAALQASFLNCIIYGDNQQLDELAVTRKGSLTFEVNFENVLYKANKDIPNGTFTDCIQNQDPQFIETDYFRMNYDFRLKESSPAVGAARPVSVSTDLAGRERDAPHPTMGCYEFKE